VQLGHTGIGGGAAVHVVLAKQQPRAYRNIERDQQDKEQAQEHRRSIRPSTAKEPTF
jgi:hypothetical protein